MKIDRLKAKNYSIVIGKNSILALTSEIKNCCPKCKKIAIIIDRKIPKKFLIKIKKKLKKYHLYIFLLTSSEKIKNFNQTNLFIDKLLKLNFNRTDLIIGIGGGIIGDMTGFCFEYF